MILKMLTHITIGSKSMKSCHLRVNVYTPHGQFRGCEAFLLKATTFIYLVVGSVSVMLRCLYTS